MKKQLLTAIAVVASLCGFAQTKGTNTLGFGVDITTHELASSSGSSNGYKYRNYNLGYGHFIKDNTRIGLVLSYGSQVHEETTNTELESFGGSMTYQQYYPIIKKLYLFAGGVAGYDASKQEARNGTQDQ
jgi:hypothetical protein